MNNSPLKFLFVILFSFLVNELAAQTKNNELVKNVWAIDAPAIDGKLTDWGDSLKYFNESTQFSFDIRNNQDFLYVAVISKNKQSLNRLLSRGITFSVNTEDKKKNGATIIFPVIDRLNLSNGANEKAPPAPVDKQFQQQIISKITKINVSGFQEIIDGPVSLKNSYGISAAAEFDSQNNFVIELAIPFSQLGISPLAGQQIACLFQLNGVKQLRTSSYDPNRNSRAGMYGSPSRDYGYDRRPVVNKQNLTAGFWVKSILATKINN